MPEPVSGAEVGATPTLRWKTLPGVARYQLWVIDAGTTELVFDLVITDAVEAEHVVVLPPLTPGRPYAGQVQGLDAAGNLLAQGDSRFTVAPVGASAEPPACAGAFERRELSEPYRRHRDDEPRYTLSADELDAYLAAMGIQSLCIPVECGAPFVNVDWDTLVQDLEGGAYPPERQATVARIDALVATLTFDPLAAGHAPPTAERVPEPDYALAPGKVRRIKLAT